MARTRGGLGADIFNAAASAKPAAGANQTAVSRKISEIVRAPNEAYAGIKLCIVAMKAPDAPLAANKPTRTSPVPAAPIVIHAASCQRIGAIVTAGSANSSTPLGLIAAAVMANTPASKR